MPATYGCYTKEVERLPKLAEKEATEAVERAIASFAKSLTRKGLKEFREIVRDTKVALDKFAAKYPDLVDEIDSLSVYLQLGPVTMEWEGFYTRSDQLSGVLDAYVNEPPAFRRGPLLDFIRAMGPTSVDAGISAQAALFVVSSKELSIGAGVGAVRSTSS